MTAGEIRDTFQTRLRNAIHSEPDHSEFTVVQTQVFIELAAQIAEINEKLIDLNISVAEVYERER
jgi:hypothetical protein